MFIKKCLITMALLLTIHVQRFNYDEFKWADIQSHCIFDKECYNCFIKIYSCDCKSKDISPCWCNNNNGCFPTDYNVHDGSLIKSYNYYEFEKIVEKNKKKKDCFSESD